MQARNISDINEFKNEFLIEKKYDYQVFRHRYHISSPEICEAIKSLLDEEANKTPVNPRALLLLAQIHIQNNPFSAVQRLYKSAQLGEIDALNCLLNLYDNGNQDALNCLLNLYDNGNQDTVKPLIVLFENNYRNNTTIEFAAELYRKSKNYRITDTKIKSLLYISMNNLVVHYHIHMGLMNNEDLPDAVKDLFHKDKNLVRYLLENDDMLTDKQRIIVNQFITEDCFDFSDCADDLKKQFDKLSHVSEDNPRYSKAKYQQMDILFKNILNIESPLSPPDLLSSLLDYYHIKINLLNSYSTPDQLSPFDPVINFQVRQCPDKTDHSCAPNEASSLIANPFFIEGNDDFHEYLALLHDEKNAFGVFIYDYLKSSNEDRLSIKQGLEIESKKENNAIDTSSLVKLSMILELEERTSQEALRLLKRAVDLNDTFAIIYLADKYSYRCIHKSDLPISKRLPTKHAAENLYQRAITLGCNEAKAKLGDLYYRIEELDKAKQLFLECAADGCTRGMICLSHMYFKGECVEQDFSESETLFKQAIAAGSITAMIAYATTLINCDDERIDIKAKKWLEEAAENGSIIAMQLLGQPTIDDDTVDNNETIDEIIKWLTKAAHLGFAPSALCLASLDDHTESMKPSEKIQMLNEAARCYSAEAVLKLSKAPAITDRLGYASHIEFEYIVKAIHYGNLSLIPNLIIQLLSSPSILEVNQAKYWCKKLIDSDSNFLISQANESFLKNTHQKVNDSAAKFWLSYIVENEVDQKLCQSFIEKYMLTKEMGGSNMKHHEFIAKILRKSKLIPENMSLVHSITVHSNNNFIVNYHLFIAQCEGVNISDDLKKLFYSNRKLFIQLFSIDDQFNINNPLDMKIKQLIADMIANDSFDFSNCENEVEAQFVKLGNVPESSSRYAEAKWNQAMMLFSGILDVTDNHLDPTRFLTTMLECHTLTSSALIYHLKKMISQPRTTDQNDLIQKMLQALYSEKIPNDPTIHFSGEIPDSIQSLSVYLSQYKILRAYAVDLMKYMHHVKAAFHDSDRKLALRFSDLSNIPDNPNSVISTLAIIEFARSILSELSFDTSDFSKKLLEAMPKLTSDIVLKQNGRDDRRFRSPSSPTLFVSGADSAANHAAASNDHDHSVTGEKLSP